MSEPTESTAVLDSRVRALERPHENLLLLYLLQSLAALVFAPLVFLPLYFKYRTLRYAIDEDGIRVSWGVLFRREINLTYRRIQDIHVQRNLLERWLDIGTVQIQTASGSAEAEMSLVGIRDYETVRDFLYRRMRGLEPPGSEETPRSTGVAGSGNEGDTIRLLHEIRDELVAVRKSLEVRS